MRRLSVVLLLSMVGHRMQPQGLPIDVLRVAHAIETNRRLLRRLPMYTCLETIARSRPTRRSTRSQKADVLQLDVGVGADREVYSWPGERTFSATDLAGLVGHGLLATGLFQSFANSLFVLGHGNVRFAGEELVEGMSAYRFTYTVPSLESRWVINWQGAAGVLGQRGEFWVNREDLVLLKLHVLAEDIPLDIRLSSLEIWIRYQPLLLNETSAIGPADAELTAVERGGKTYINNFRFSQCRVFGAQSKLADDTGDLEQKLSRYEAKQGVLPAGLALRVSLKQAIDSKSSKVGDLITGLIDAPLKLPQGIVIPRGSTVNGRIREFTRLNDPPNTFLVGLEFDELIVTDQDFRFLAEMTGMQELQGLTTAIFSGTTKSIRSLEGAAYLTTTEKLRADRIPGVATFFLQDRLEVPKSFTMTWRTQANGHP